jgi:hypothetical protein
MRARSRAHIIGAMTPVGRGKMRMTVDDLLAEARGVLPHRPGPAEALAAQAKAP